MRSRMKQVQKPGKCIFQNTSRFIILICILALLTSCTDSGPIDDEIGGEGMIDKPAPGDKPGERGKPSGGEGLPGGDTVLMGDTLTTYIQSSGIGNIAVQVSIPQEPRYEDGAGVVVEVNTFLTPTSDFYSSVDVTSIGLIHVTYLWPGKSSRMASSDGSFDYGGKKSIEALRDVILFASGEISNTDGKYLHELIEIQPLYENVGIYAFSHPGLAAVNVLGRYGSDLGKVAYYIGRENPTNDILTAVEIGHFDESNTPVFNPLYDYPANYDARGINIDYSSLSWTTASGATGGKWSGMPYFDLNGNGMPDGADYVLGTRVPAKDGKRLYSLDLLSALRDKNVLLESEWPDDLARFNEAREIWNLNNSTTMYKDVGSKISNLKVMLVFAEYDHVQPAEDKPHIHHAYDGFRFGANLWVRMNPDEAYVAEIDARTASGYSDHSVNTEPSNWLDIESWGYRNTPGASQIVPLAAVAEMADRAYYGNWAEDLTSILQ